MTNAPLEISLDERTRLRTIVAAIDGQIACLMREGTADEHREATAALAHAWTGLVDLLALGAASATRVCPTCQKIGRRQATRCGYCWTTLNPLSLAAPDDAN